MLKKCMLNALGAATLVFFSHHPVLAQMHTAIGSSSTVPEKVFNPTQLQEDLAFIKNTIATIHPELSYTADSDQLARVYQELGVALQDPMSKDAAWRAFALLNPYFADGHLMVAHASSRAEADSHLAKGQGFFPFEVFVDDAANLYIRAALDSSNCEFKGSRIEQINGMPASLVARELLKRMGGDNAAFQANLLSRRFWLPYIKTFGASDHFSLVITRDGQSKQLQIPAIKTLPKSLRDADDFEQAFQFEIINKRTALLTIRNFYWPDHKAFYAFTKQVFAKIHAAQLSNLIIDVRDNTGGDDVMWKEGVLPYLASHAYRHCSTYRKRVLAGRQSGSERVGDVADGTCDTWTQADVTNPYFFTGNTYVLVGRLTYSSAVLFSNVVQDFGFGKLVGEAGYVRSRQTGGINQTNTLPNTGLEIVVPRFILDRPSGEREPSLLRPDIVLSDDPFNERALVLGLVNKLDLE